MKRMISCLLALSIAASMAVPALALGPGVAEQSAEQRVAQVMAEPRYLSTEPAKQSWALAYAGFYNASERIKGATADEAFSSIVQPRGGFAYSIFKLGDTNNTGIPRTVREAQAALGRLLTDPTLDREKFLSLCAYDKGQVGLLVDYVGTDNYYGEATAIAFEPSGWQLNGSHVRHYEVGQYQARHSLTMVEGLENQLLDLGFRPETTTAFYLSIDSFGSGIAFMNQEQFCFVLKNGTVPGTYGVEASAPPAAGLAFSLGQVGQSIIVSARININDVVTANPPTGKPVIYLYPERTTDVAVKLGYPAEYLTYTYPAYKSGWSVTAHPDGRLVNHEDGSEHYYLFWEGDKVVDWDFSRGFVVKGSETEAFLREKLPLLGLLPREYNDFITYWVPKMKDAPYNLISFGTEQYEALAPLFITPTPDTVLRVHMTYKPLQEPIEVPTQALPTPPVREGFTVVEWGGSHN